MYPAAGYKQIIVMERLADTPPSGMYPAAGYKQIIMMECLADTQCWIDTPKNHKTPLIVSSSFF